MNAHGELNELEQFKAVVHNLNFVFRQIILSLDRDRGRREKDKETEEA